MLAEKMFAFALMGSEWVLWLLVFMSALCIAIAIERTLFIRQQSTPMNSLQDALTKYLSGGEHNDFSKALSSLKGLEANILKAGLEANEKGGSQSAEDIGASIQ